jgi:hypothetical protein
MKFSQFDNEHVAQAWKIIKSMIKNCPTHGLTTWMIVQTFYAGLNFSSRNLLNSAAGGTFMSITLGAATKLLDNMMVNHSEWHTERAPQGKKVNSVEETSSLCDKIDAIMLMLSNDRTHVDPNNVSLASLIAQEEQLCIPRHWERRWRLGVRSRLRPQGEEDLGLPCRLPFQHSSDADELLRQSP